MNLFNMHDIPRPPTELSLILSGLAGGFVVHHGLFIRGEWHVQAPQIAVFHLGLYAIPPVLSFAYGGTTVGFLARALVLISCGYLPGLILSILLYRFFFHRLRRAGFQGPWYAALSKLWHVWACRDSQNHLVMDKLHRKYGDFVRTGPSEITIFDPDVFMAVDGPRTECIKAEWYDILSPRMALVTARIKNVHAARRREWNHGFTTKALALHEAKILRYVDQLDDCLEADARAGRLTNLRDVLFWFGFDIMGDFVFSKSFGMLQSQNWHHIIVRLQRALSLLGPFSPVPWLLQVGFKLGPRVMALRDWFEMTAWCRGQMRERMESGKSAGLRDLTYYLMEDGERTESSGIDSLFWLDGDSLLAIVAGSEPTAVALMGVFCELAKHPEHATKIYEEVAGVNTTDLHILNRLPHLNAVINETLRLYPALLTGGNRKTTVKGATIAGRFIPPETTIIAPRYTIARREDCFERAHEFIPERWTTRPEMVRNGAAFAPFGTGHHSCLGRALATDTMRFVVARILQKYRFRFAPGDDGTQTMRHMKDQFTSNPGALQLYFELR